jgi:arylsulfatase A
LVEHLRSGGVAALPRDQLYWHFPHYRHAPGPYSIIRKGDQKLIKFWAGKTELYNLRDDLAETTDLADDQPEQAAELERRLLDGLREMGAKLPIPNPEYRPD